MLGLGVVSCDVETMLRRVVITFYETDPRPPPADVVDVAPLAETEPVLDDTDAADDPAIWVNPADASASWVIGTNKRRGVEVYDMEGKRRWRLDAGRINNVDLRANVMIAGEPQIVVAGTNRTAISIDVWALTPSTGRLTSLLAAPIPAELDDPYGFCLYQRPPTARCLPLPLARRVAQCSGACAMPGEACCAASACAASLWKANRKAASSTTPTPACSSAKSKWASGG